MLGRTESSGLEPEGSLLQSHWEQDKEFDQQLRTSYEKYAQKQLKHDKELAQKLDAINSHYEESEAASQRRIKEVYLRASKLRSMTLYTPAERALENAKKTYIKQLETITRTEVSSILDLSYQNIQSLKSAAKIRPRICKNAARPHKDSARYAASTIRLNNNCLVELTELEVFLQEILHSPNNLTWLDLSFNQIQKLNESLSSLQLLSFLYLHGNALQSLTDICNALLPLPKLAHLTLNGNPFQESNPQYRPRIITTLVSLINLDFAHITQWERQLAQDRKQSITIAKQTLKKKPIRNFFI